MTRYSALICIISVFLTNCQPATLFEKLDPSDTGIDFANTLTETESQNILAYEYFYNGGGVAAADFNNDGLTDLFFTGNQVENKLYLNTSILSSVGGKGGVITFEDITKSAFPSPLGAGGASWKTGVAVADVNADGWLDIYVCRSGNGSPESRKNQLFINNGLWKKNSPPTGGGWGGAFTEQAEPYGVADVGYSTHATFFDYDLDGDLDLFVLNHNLKGYQRKEAAYMKATFDPYAGDRLYENTPLPSASPLEGGLRGVNRAFIDITQKAGIKSNALGFGLGVVVSDFNHDNWPDLYVANDYVEEDYFYFNNGDGTFTERGKEVMGHFSYSAMGVDAADINNDASPDIFTCDMLPEDSRRQKLLAFPDNWNVQRSMLDNGFHWQNMRNMLFLMPPFPSKGKGEKYPQMGGAGGLEVAQLAGVSNTDWSWAPLLADFDNDGFKDLFISNGFVKDLTDLDFVKYQSELASMSNVPLLEQLKQMPSTATHHYIFKNNGDLTFQDKVKDWGFEQNTVASGAVYADLDNDGDLDLITNNTNEPARIYKNNQQENSPQSYLKIELKGNAQNTYALGTKVWVYADNKIQYLENQPTHGFQASIVAPLHFGLGAAKSIDSVRVQWPNGNVELIKNPKVNTKLQVVNKSIGHWKNQINNQELITNNQQPLNYVHHENFNIDFNRQILLPRLYSQNGPRMAVGDVNGDGLEDVFFCSAKDQTAELMIQNVNGQFSKSPQKVFDQDKAAEDIDAVLFDADGDKDLDLYVVSGGYEQVLDDPILQDRLYLNNGRGQFSKVMLPQMFTNKSCVKVLDYDRDGDLDLFVGGSVRCGLFPYSSVSYLLQNNGKGNFIIAKTYDLGLVTDAAIADLNKDNYPEIIITAEWQPIQVLENKGKEATRQNGNKKYFEIITNKKSPFGGFRGLFSRIKAADLDGDGDMDFVVGNVGQNNQFKTNADKPVELYYADFDQSGSIDPVMTYYFGDKPYPAAGRDELMEQMPSLKKKFTDYKSYSTATIEDIFGKTVIEKTPKLTFNEPQSGLLINQNGILEWKPLPIEAQVAPVYAIEVSDFNNDGKVDILLGGNCSGYRIRIGKMDTNQGVLLLGNGKNEFNFGTTLGWQGDIRDIQQVKTKKSSLWVVSRNNGSAFSLLAPIPNI